MSARTTKSTTSEKPVDEQVDFSSTLSTSGYDYEDFSTQWPETTDDQDRVLI